MACVFCVGGGGNFNFDLAVFRQKYLVVILNAATWMDIKGVRRTLAYVSNVDICYHQ